MTIADVLPIIWRNVGGRVLAISESILLWRRGV